MDAAKSVFLERGFEAASMAEVSARAGGSKQTLYSYFASKEDLFVAMMIEKGAIQVEPLFDALQEGRDLAQGVRRFTADFVAFISSEEPIAFRRMVYAEGAKSELGRLFYEHGPKRGWTRMAEVFQRAMDEGRMRRADPWTAVHQLNALCEAGPVQQLLAGALTHVDAATLSSAAEAAADTFIRAYGL
jgi:AcrR family transcriptional regulator